MNFGALPPEVNSLRMYSGPGSAPMLAAMTAWDAVAAEMRLTAAAYESVISTLVSDGWLGPAASAMLAAAVPYLTWMSATGGQAEQAATQAAAAAAAFEAAFSMTVPPAVVAANRARLLVLVATNFFGVNTAAIAATEAEYAEMWAQDATAMYAYAGSAAAAATLTPFLEPQQTTDSSGLVSQTAAVTQATGTAAGNLSQTQLPDLMAAVPATLQELAAPAAASPFDALPQTGLLVDILNFLDGADGNPYGVFLDSSLVNALVSGAFIAPAVISPGVTDSIADVEAVVEGAEPDVAASAADAGVDDAAATMSRSGFGGGPNQAALIGRLSVPPTWAAAVEAANPGAMPLHGAGFTGVTAAPAAAPGTPGMPAMPAANAGSRSWANGPRYGTRLTVMPRPVAAG